MIELLPTFQVQSRPEYILFKYSASYHFGSLIILLKKIGQVKRGWRRDYIIDTVAFVLTFVFRIIKFTSMCRPTYKLPQNVLSNVIISAVCRTDGIE